MSSPSAAVVLVPVKSFARAKLRLAPALDEAHRATLARGMAERVLAAAAPLAVAVVCDDDEVARWAQEHGAELEWTPGLGLNGAVQVTIERRRAAGVERVVVAHGDLPFAADLASLADAAADEVVIVPDRRGRGTNVLSVPTGSGPGAAPFRVSYGPGSFERHVAEAAAAGLRARVLELEHLGWDVDEPGDLAVPAHLGTLPGMLP